MEKAFPLDGFAPEVDQRTASYGAGVGVAPGAWAEGLPSALCPSLRLRVASEVSCLPSSDSEHSPLSAGESFAARKCGGLGWFQRAGRLASRGRARVEHRGPLEASERCRASALISLGLRPCRESRGWSERD